MLIQSSKMSHVLWVATLLTLVICATFSAGQQANDTELAEKLQDLASRLAKLEKKSGCCRGQCYGDYFADLIKKDGWILVFRATSGLGSPVYDAWTREGYHDDYKFSRATMPCGCTKTKGSCDRHYRSIMLDIWLYLAIEKVKVSLYEDGAEKANMVFSGQGSSYMNWFSADRLLESSWNDVNSSAPTYFSISGIDEPGRVTRRFYVHGGHFGCPSDFGWMSIKDKGNVCAWETSDKIPTFIYSKAQTGITWESQGALVGRADVMAVWIKLRNSVNLSKPCIP